MTTPKKTRQTKKSTVAKDVATKAVETATTGNDEKSLDSAVVTPGQEQNSTSPSTTSTEGQGDDEAGDTTGDTGDTTGKVGDTGTGDLEGDSATVVTVDETDSTDDQETTGETAINEADDTTSENGETTITVEQEVDELTARLAKVQTKEEFDTARNDLLAFTSDMAGHVPQTIETLKKHQTRLYRALVRLLLEPTDDDVTAENLKFVVEVFRCNTKPGSCFSDALILRGAKMVPAGNPARQDEFVNMMVMLLNLSREGTSISIDWDVFEARITRERGPAIGRVIRRVYNIDVD